MGKREIPPISPLVREWMPNASEEELVQGTVQLSRFLAVLYRVFLRLESEGKLDQIGHEGDTHIKE